MEHIILLLIRLYVEVEQSERNSALFTNWMGEWLITSYYLQLQTHDERGRLLVLPFFAAVAV